MSRRSNLPDSVLGGLAALYGSAKTADAVAALVAANGRPRADDVGLDEELRRTLPHAVQDLRVSVIRLINEVDTLSGLIPDTAAANSSRKAASQERAKLARQLRAEGMTVAKIAKVIDRTERHTHRLLKE